MLDVVYLRYLKIGGFTIPGLSGPNFYQSPWCHEPSSWLILFISHGDRYGNPPVKNTLHLKLIVKIRTCNAGVSGAPIWISWGTVDSACELHWCESFVNLRCHLDAHPTLLVERQAGFQKPGLPGGLMGLERWCHYRCMYDVSPLYIYIYISLKFTVSNLNTLYIYI